VVRARSMISLPVFFVIDGIETRRFTRERLYKKG